MNRFLILILAMTFFGSCKRTTTLSGRVLNLHTGNPIEGATIYLYDEDVAVFEESEITGYATTLSDASGYFEMNLKTPLNANVRYNAGKTGYTNPETENAVSGVGLRTGQDKEVTIQLAGIAYFNPPFKKKSAEAENNDLFKVTLLSYEDFNQSLNFWSPFSFNGIGPFIISSNPYSIPFADGDRYLRYKLEWTNDGVWQSKIDSVYLPTSLEVYRDTIFY